MSHGSGFRLKTVLVLPFVLLGSFWITTGVASAGVTDPPCVKYTWDSTNDFLGSQDSYQQVTNNPSGADLIATMRTDNGHYSSYCGNFVNGWTAESFVVNYYWNGSSYVLCTGPLPYQWVSSTNGSAYANAACDGARSYQSGFSSRVWFAGSPRDSGLAYSIQSW
jgi:hypothetical protein